MPTKQRARTGWRRRQRILQNYIAANGYVCPGLGRPPHPALNLEVDHVVPLVLGGDDRDGLRVLCTRCNRSHGAKLGNALRRGTRINSRAW